ncbi:hypothetical protein ACGRHY_22765 [Streptomyces sp. HK10]|uniref:hypothetical protein n=1 Tax=Streptomyces sp. HK10 TaxID=3373255 RepID=UPI003748C222
MSTQPVSHPPVVRALWVLVAVLFSALVALIAGILSGAAGSPFPEAVLHAGGAFAATLPLCLTVLSALRAL